MRVGKSAMVITSAGDPSSTEAIETGAVPFTRRPKPSPRLWSVTCLGADQCLFAEKRASGPKPLKGSSAFCVAKSGGLNSNWNFVAAAKQYQQSAKICMQIITKHLTKIVIRFEQGRFYSSQIPSFPRTNVIPCLSFQLQLIFMPLSTPHLFLGYVFKGKNC